MYLAIKNVQPTANYQLILTFENGEKRQFDMNPYLGLGIFQELRVHFSDLSDAARVDHLLGIQIHRAIALLKTERDVHLAIRAVGQPDHALAIRHGDAGRLLDVDMLAGFYGCFKVVGVQEHGGGDDHRVHVAGQHLLEVLRGGRVLGVGRFGLG